MVVIGNVHFSQLSLVWMIILGHEVQGVLDVGDEQSRTRCRLVDLVCRDNDPRI